MSTKRAEQFYPESTLNKADEDEPLFILRAQDKLAPQVVRLWAASLLAALLGDGENASQAQVDKVTRAMKLAIDMEAWQAQHSARVKIPD